MQWGGGSYVMDRIRRMLAVGEDRLLNHHVELVVAPLNVATRAKKGELRLAIRALQPPAEVTAAQQHACVGHLLPLGRHQRIKELVSLKSLHQQRERRC